MGKQSLIAEIGQMCGIPILYLDIYKISWTTSDVQHESESMSRCPVTCCSMNLNQ